MLTKGVDPPPSCPSGTCGMSVYSSVAVRSAYIIGQDTHTHTATITHPRIMTSEELYTAVRAIKGGVELLGSTHTLSFRRG